MTKAKHRFAPKLKQPVTWLDTSRSPRRREARPAVGTGYLNKYECELVNGLLRRLNKQFARRSPEGGERVTVAVITGYQEQVRVLERTLRPRSASWTQLEIMLHAQAPSVSNRQNLGKAFT